MSTYEQFASGGSRPSAASNSRLDCPQCKRRMIVKQVMPLLFATNMDDILFGCEPCGLEIKRAVKRA